jgi:hypothetical protein
LFGCQAVVWIDLAKERWMIGSELNGTGSLLNLRRARMIFHKSGWLVTGFSRQSGCKLLVNFERPNYQDCRWKCRCFLLVSVASVIHIMVTCKQSYLGLTKKQETKAPPPSKWPANTASETAGSLAFFG